MKIVATLPGSENERNTSPQRPGFRATQALVMDSGDIYNASVRRPRGAMDDEEPRDYDENDV